MNHLLDQWNLATDENRSTFSQLGIIGEMMHTITDAKADGHILRIDEQISQVQDYTQQVPDVHGEGDFKTRWIDPQKGASALNAATELVHAWQHNQNWNALSEYLYANVYNIRPGYEEQTYGWRCSKAEIRRQETA